MVCVSDRFWESRSHNDVAIYIILDIYIHMIKHHFHAVYAVLAVNKFWKGGTGSLGPPKSAPGFSAVCTCLYVFMCVLHMYAYMCVSVYVQMYVCVCI